MGGYVLQSRDGPLDKTRQPRQDSVLFGVLYSPLSFVYRSTKKVFAQGKFKWKKIHARQLTLQNIHVTVWKIHTRNFITKKNSYDSKIPHPSPITFLMVRPWIGKTVNTTIVLQEKSQSGVNQFVVLWPVFCCDGGGCVYICTYIRRQVECTLYWG